MSGLAPNPFIRFYTTRQIMTMSYLARRKQPQPLPIKNTSKTDNMVLRHKSECKGTKELLKTRRKRGIFFIRTVLLIIFNN